MFWVDNLVSSEVSFNFWKKEQHSCFVSNDNAIVFVCETKNVKPMIISVLFFYIQNKQNKHICEYHIRRTYLVSASRKNENFV